MLKRYAIKRYADQAGMHLFIETAVFPPRFNEWTKEMVNAQLFDNEREAQACADFNKTHAFNCEVFELEVDQTDHRIETARQRWQEASDMVHDSWGLDKTRVEIKE